jgi:hypothetical protein
MFSLKVEMLLKRLFLRPDWAFWIASNSLTWKMNVSAEVQRVAIDLLFASRAFRNRWPAETTGLTIMLVNTFTVLYLTVEEVLRIRMRG